MSLAEDVYDSLSFDPVAAKAGAVAKNGLMVRGQIRTLDGQHWARKARRASSL